MNTLPDEVKACINPLEDQRKQALEHYREVSSKACHWSSFVEAAIKAYVPDAGKEEMPDDIMKTITVELPQHPKIKGTMNIVSDSFDFNYADIETHHGLQASFESDSIEYKLLLSACVNIAKNIRVIEDIHNGKNAAFTKQSNESLQQAAKEWVLKNNDMTEGDIVGVPEAKQFDAFLAGASFNKNI